MAERTKRLLPGRLQSDRDSFAALQALAGYTPANGAYSLAELGRVLAELEEARTAEVQAEAARAAARDRAAAKEWEFHELVQGAKDQVVAQFGRDSHEVQAVGRKRVSEYKAGRGRRPAPR
jgi:hypothetical protein